MAPRDLGLGGYAKTLLRNVAEGPGVCEDAETLLAERVGDEGGGVAAQTTGLGGAGGVVVCGHGHGETGQGGAEQDAGVAEVGGDEGRGGGRVPEGGGAPGVGVSWGGGGRGGRGGGESKMKRAKGGEEGKEKEEKEEEEESKGEWEGAREEGERKGRAQKGELRSRYQRQARSRPALERVCSRVRVCGHLASGILATQEPRPRLGDKVHVRFQEGIHQHALDRQTVSKVGLKATKVPANSVLPLGDQPALGADSAGLKLVGGRRRRTEAKLLARLLDVRVQVVLEEARAVLATVAVKHGEIEHGGVSWRRRRAVGRCWHGRRGGKRGQVDNAGLVPVLVVRAIAARASHAEVVLCRAQGDAYDGRRAGV